MDDTPISSFMDKETGIVYETHLPLNEWFNHSEIGKWARNEPSMLDEQASKTISAYELYRKNSRKNLSPSEEYSQKRRFSKSSYIIALKNDLVIGGMWVNKKKKKRIINVFVHDEHLEEHIGQIIDKIFEEKHS